MGCWSKIKDFLKGCDLFSQPVVLRFADSSSYETATGGFCSLILLAVFVAIFMGTAVSTLNKEYISSTTEIFEENDPSYFSVGSNNFMFALGLEGVNLNEGDRWFNIELKFKSYSSEGRAVELLPLVPCSREHWTSVEKEFGEIYDRFGFQSWLCPANNSTFQLQGKYTSEVFKFYEIKVKGCTPVPESDRSCVNGSLIQDYLSDDTFKLSFYFVNTIINAGSHKYISYYLEDMNYFEFTTHAGVKANVFLSAYTITTDQSIYPFSDMRNDTGGIVNKLAQVHHFEILGEEYVKLYLRKSSTDILVERSFRKADDTLSYIGGLFSAILALMFMLIAYNETCYEIDIAKSIYRDEQGHPIHSEKFTFFTYIFYSFSQLLECLGCSPLCSNVAIYGNAVEEIRKQMDIRLLLKRLAYCERGLHILLEEHRAQVLHLQRPLTFNEAQELRKEYMLYDEMEELAYKQRFESGQINTKPRMKRFVSNMVSPTEFSEVYEKNDWGEESGSEEQLKRKIRKIKVHIGKLQKEAKQSNQLSKKVLEKFCDPVKKIFQKKNFRVANEQRDPDPQSIFDITK